MQLLGGTDVLVFTCFPSFVPSLQPYSFNLWHPKLLAKQPEHVQELFPAVLTHRSAIDRKLVQLMRILSLNRVKLSAFREMLRQMYHLRVASLRIQFTSTLLRWKKFHGKRFCPRPLNPQERMHPPAIDWAAAVKDGLPTLKGTGAWVPSGMRTPLSTCGVCLFSQTASFFVACASLSICMFRLNL